MKSELRKNGMLGKAAISLGLLISYWIPLCAWLMRNTPASGNMVVTYDSLFEATLNTLSTSLVSAVLSTSVAYLAICSLQLYAANLSRVLALVLLPGLLIGYLARCYAWQGIFLTIESITSIRILHTWPGIIFVLAASFLPISIALMFISCSRVGNNSLLAARSLGAKPGEVFTKILLPLTYRGALSTCLLIACAATGYFVTVRFIGGGKWDTLPKRILDYTWALGDRGAAAMPAIAALMIGAFLVTLAVVLDPLTRRRRTPDE